MIIKNAKVFEESGKFVEKDIYMDGANFAEAAKDEEIIDAAGCYAIPGLVDVHLHGCVRNDFSDSDVAGINQMAEYEAANGVTSICPTTMTLSEEHLTRACKNIAQAGTDTGANIIGINLEGPFVSPNKLGAQNPEFVAKPDAEMFRRLNEASGGIVKLLAVAPEMEGALEMIAAVRDEVHCSIAHTLADYDTAMKAFAAGADHVTHLYNAMPPLGHREPGVIGAAADTPDCRAEMICDNVHIHPAVVRASFRFMGDDRIIFISDSMMATGLDDGEYSLGGLAVHVTGNVARLTEGGAIAGSVTNLMKCMQTAVRVAKIPLASAVKCATVNPAKSIGMFDRYGSIAPGKSADVVLLDADLNVQRVFLRGRMLNQ